VGQGVARDLTPALSEGAKGCGRNPLIAVATELDRTSN